MSKSVPFGVLAPATQLVLRARAQAQFGFRLLRTDAIILDKSPTTDTIIVTAHSHILTTETHNDDGLPATSLWSQLNAVYSGL